MTCNKCNHKLPDDSEFCQYCGNKIEQVDVVPIVDEPNGIEDTIVLGELNIDNMTREELLDTFIKFQAKNTINAMEANAKTQPNCESGADFGLVPQNPIYTLALKSVDGEKEYLKKLRTESGERIQYTRRGSTSVEGVNGMIDIYDTFLPSGQPYKTIYINMYGAKESTKAPLGFTFSKINQVQRQNTGASHYSKGSRIQNDYMKTAAVVKNISMVLAAISAVLIIVALNLQDRKRNIYEELDPTMLYAILLSVNLVYIAMLFVTKGKKYAASDGIGVFALVAIASIMWVEGTILSDSYYRDGRYYTYGHANTLATVNMLWLMLYIAILLLNLLPLVKISTEKWYGSVRYREKCYDRVAKMKDYLEKGIMTQGEFDKSRQEILKHIEK